MKRQKVTRTPGKHLFTKETELTESPVSRYYFSMLTSNSFLSEQTLSSGRLFVVSGPSGVGKGTLLSRLYERVSAIVPSISATTRPPRPGELDGVNYFFLDRAEFEKDIRDGFFLEYAQYGANYYGTPLQPVEEKLSHSIDVLLEVERVCSERKEFEVSIEK